MPPEIFYFLNKKENMDWQSLMSHELNSQSLKKFPVGWKL